MSVTNRLSIRYIGVKARRTGRAQFQIKGVRGTKLQDYEDQLAVYAVEVTKWMVSRGVRPDQAQDVVQDVFVKMLEQDLFIPPSKLRSWMYRVAMRDHIDQYRRNQKYQTILLALTKELSALTETPPDLTPFLNQLKPSERKLLQHYYYEKLSIKDLAQKMKVSESKVKIDLFRARRKLRKILEKEGFDEWKI